jgi:polyisoprenoid-binding protein YceI
VNYEIDPAHTYPSFEADHMGLSFWRGKFNKSKGSVMLDREAGVGRVVVLIDPDSIDFGYSQMNSVARSAQFFDTQQFQNITYIGDLSDFVDGVPTKVKGELTLHGVTKPVELKLIRFACKPHPLFKREVCGADALTVFRRDEFGIDMGKAFGFNMEVTLRIQIEAIAQP